MQQTNGFQMQYRPVRNRLPTLVFLMRFVFGPQRGRLLSNRAFDARTKVWAHARRQERALATPLQSKN